MDDVIFIGSSVCVGYGATGNFGWSAKLARDFEAQGKKTFNCAIGGQRTAHILLRLDKDVISRHPAYCFVGLGLANEGYAQAQTEEARLRIEGTFESNLYTIAHALQQNGIRVALGGLYPNNGYSPAHFEGLHRVQQTMMQWGFPVLNWLDALSDEQGRFKPGLFFDGGHPNDAGYQLMYECIPENILDQLKKEKE